MERKIHFRENWLIFWGICGEVELVLRIWGARKNTFRELRNFLKGFGEINALFSHRPPWGASLYTDVGVMASLFSAPVLRHLAESSITTTEINL